MLRSGVPCGADIDKYVASLSQVSTATQQIKQRNAGSGLAVLDRCPIKWEDVKWLRERWTGPLVIKGVLSGSDAQRAVDVGANGVVVSNHGGRQLDGVAPSILALPEVVATVGRSCEVFMDGGIRRGTDVVKALALGAKAVLVGRSYLWGLAVDGAFGVERILRIYQTDVARTLRLLGASALSDLDLSYLRTDLGILPSLLG
jgi:isopentenyl diphosphate isomerase/L-lactate dehydrogenase-like FMN-dependent dehydrogenase